MAVLGAAVLAVLLRLSAGKNAVCDYTYNVLPDQRYYINNTYPPYTKMLCRWVGICPPGYRCRLDCQLNLPDSPGCFADRVLISRSEGPDINSTDEFCGPGSTNFVTYGKQITADLTLTSNSPGNDFTCQLTSEGKPDPPPGRCGYKKLNRIVNGVETGVNEFPMMANVVHRYQPTGRRGGTIIDKRYVLTAAHAAHEDTEDLLVIVGEHDLSSGGETPATYIYGVERITLHPQYSHLKSDNDIAILRLNEDIEFSDRVGPACLPFKFTNNSFTGLNVTLLGWGSLSVVAPVSDVLRKVDVTVISQGPCQAAHPRVTPRQMCTYTPGKDSCEGDSGGPALYTDPATSLLFIAGVVSYGRGCATADTPAVNTRVTEYLDWIRNNTPGAEYSYE